MRVTNVACTGSENNIFECVLSELSYNDAISAVANNEAAGVDCIYDQPTEPPCIQRPDSYGTPGTVCSSGSIRLANSSQPGVGRLEYCYNGYWSPFCKLDPVAASLACQYLGYNDYTC